MHALSAFTLACALTAWAGVAAAQEQGLDARTLRTPIDPRAGALIDPATIPKDGFFAGSVSVGAFKAPLRLGDQRVVSTRREVSLALAAVVHPRLMLGLELPWVLQESRPLTPAVAGVSHTAGSGLGDLSVGGKFGLKDNEYGGLGLALRGDLQLPTGDPATFAAERTVRGQLGVLADLDMMIAGVQASLGVRLRSENVQVTDAVRAGHELPFHVALWLRPSLFKLDPSERQRWELGVYGAVPLAPAGPFGLGAPGSAWLTPIAVRAGDRIVLGKKRDVQLTAGVEFGLGGAIGSPSYGAFLRLSYFPREHDRDHDGIDDLYDACPDLPAGPNAAHGDGCPPPPPPPPKPAPKPRPDRDGDGIPDDEDACPDEPGVGADDRRCYGCAVGDRDGDGVDDYDDVCPDQPGQGVDGCPEPEG